MYLKNGAVHMSESEWDAIPDDMKGYVTHEYKDDRFKSMLGFRTMRVKRENVVRVLFEGISFIIDQEPSPIARDMPSPASRAASSAQTCSL